MNNAKKLLIILFTIGISEQFFAQNIQVTDNVSAQDLIQNTLINSSCAAVFNFSATGGNFGSSEQSFGSFTAGTSGFPFAKGIVLSTSKAVSTQGSNNNLLSEDASGWIGDIDLEQALSISNTSNATILEFDFIPFASKISFDYLFASEEYHDTAPCKYSDGFGFLLKVAGSSDPYQNLALVPNTNTPVKVTSVHPDIPGSCPAANENYFGSYNDTNAPINFNGQTVVMTAKATVITGTKYHIKLVIADETNPQYDSAIFLGGGTFQVGTDLGENKLIATKNPLCVGEKLLLDATEIGLNTYKWFLNGNEIFGQTNPIYQVTTNGVYSVEVTLGGTSCVAKGQVTIEYSPLPVLKDATLIQCDDNNDGVTTYDLRKLDNYIRNNVTTLSGITYYETLQNAKDQTSPIPTTTAYTNISSNPIYARVTNTFGCANFAKVDLKISNNPIADQEYKTCDSDKDQDGFTKINLSLEVTPQLNPLFSSGLTVEYYASEKDAIIQKKALPNIFPNTIANEQIIYARVVNGSDCFGIIKITLKINTFKPAKFQDETVYICNGVPIPISIAMGFKTYKWTNGDIVNMTTVAKAGQYSVTVTNVNDCKATKKFNVIDSGTAIITAIDVNDFSGTENTILINYSGAGTYEFSLDGINFQTSNFFTNVNIGSYFITIRDINGCGKTVSNIVYVLDYPKFFTPNGDGFNDYWKIKNLESQPNAIITIFDRFGKLIKQITPTQNGWDGTYNEKPLIADDYWFNIILENNKTIKGHFALKR